MPGKAIRVSGVVQGVGFRPYIWRLAERHLIRGAVWNDESGVTIHAWGPAQALERFIRDIPLNPPPLAKLLELHCSELDSPPETDGFAIRTSRAGAPPRTPVAADAAVCPACAAEIDDPYNRRYRYPFTNCTHCGPRLSVVRRIPYDRRNTSMDEFPLCPACRAEYANPEDRRFHAQATCCPDCGPAVRLEDAEGNAIECADAVRQAAALLGQGLIVAVKGLGGYHLACDATNPQAVETLRQRKGRYQKPLALMAKNVAAVRRYCRVDGDEEAALADRRASIVLLERLSPAGGAAVAHAVAFDDGKLGFMLPYTPLHRLLLQELDAPLVMTSGNVSDEPQCVDNAEARSRLSGIADALLTHNRAIVNRLDDSVVRKMAGEIRVLRRGRGFAPEALVLPEGFEEAPPVLAMGAELKNSFCLLKDGRAVVSQHIGDLESAAVQRDYRRQLDLYRQLFEFTPQTVAVDRHPGYLSTQHGLELARQCGIDAVEVQHHHAHAAACLAEHGLPLDTAPVLAIVLDGLGMGTGHQLWGGEFLYCGYAAFERLGYFRPVAMPGGVQSIREPWRSAYAQLRHYFDVDRLPAQYGDLDIFRLLQEKPLQTLAAMIDRGLNSPPSSSCGRWFDALAAMVGICPEQVGYEGQAAIGLETLAEGRFDDQEPYAYGHRLIRNGGEWVLDWLPLWRGVLNDLRQKTDRASIAARCHHALSDACAAMTSRLSRQKEFGTVVLSGGVFQNRLLLESLTARLHRMDFKVLVPKDYPTNDGGIALGQAASAAAKCILRNIRD
ncbi:MAG: carbamoyltransferase HypF [Gammaproteobacteria bacterium]